MPKCDLPIDVYIYCTNDNELLCQLDNEWNTIRVVRGAKLKSIYNGKVVAKFTLRKVEGIEYDTCSRDISGFWKENGERFNLKPTCLSFEELFAYLKCDKGYAYHIEDLVIFDKPKELSEFRKHNFKDTVCEKCGVPNKPNMLYCCGCEDIRLTKAPRSYCFIESEE